jgi:CheY-like chemotaxis protein
MALVRPSVLLVEDDPDTRHMYATCLDVLGFDVSEARDGLEGVRCAQAVHPDIVLMDVAMPRMDGLEATRRLKNDPETASVPILILSAFTTQQDRQRALEAGAAEFVAKPCDPEALAQRLRRYS